MKKNNGAINDGNGNYFDGNTTLSTTSGLSQTGLPYSDDNLIKNKYNAIKAEGVGEILSKLMGEVLTIIDASTEGDRNKAIKDLIKEKFHKKQDVVYELSQILEEEPGSGHMPKYEYEDWLIPYSNNEQYGFQFSNIKL